MGIVQPTAEREERARVCIAGSEMRIVAAARVREVSDEPISLSQVSVTQGPSLGTAVGLGDGKTMGSL